MLTSEWKKTIASIAIFVVLAGVAFYLYLQKPVKTPTSPEDFFKLIDEIADSGRLDNPAYIERKLHVEFNKRRAEDHFDNCDQDGEHPQNTQTPLYKSRISDYYQPKYDFWFGAAFGKRQDLTTEKLMINRTKPPELNYEIFRSLTCDGPHKDDPEINATLRFDYIPTFQLIDEDIFKLLRPSIRQEMVNDTHDRFFVHAAKAAKKYGSTITYRLEQEMDGKYYVRSVEITQSENFGSKTAHANQ